MPLADGHAIAKEVLAGIVMQDYPLKLVPLSRPQDQTNRRISECLCRNELRAFCTGEYVMMMDSDVVLRSPHTVKAMVSMLSATPEIEAVAVDTKGQVVHGHTVIACMVVRSTSLGKKPFRMATPEGCVCMGFNEDFVIDVLHGQYAAEVKTGR